MGWKETLRKARMEQKYDLDTLPGEWVVLKKFSVEAHEKLAAAREQFDVDEQGQPKKMGSPGSLVEFHILILRYGLVEASFTDDDGSKIELGEEFFRELLDEAPEVEDEIFKAITVYNAPLAPENDDSSETAPDGSSKDDASQLVQDPIRTD